MPQKNQGREVSWVMALRYAGRGRVATANNEWFAQRTQR